jgi:hypothetical protein
MADLHRALESPVAMRSGWLTAPGFDAMPGLTPIQKQWQESLGAGGRGAKVLWGMTKAADWTAVGVAVPMEFVQGATVEAVSAFVGLENVVSHPIDTAWAFSVACPRSLQVSLAGSSPS